MIKMITIKHCDTIGRKRKRNINAFVQSIAEISDGTQYTLLFTHMQEQLIQTTTHTHRRAMRWFGIKMPYLEIKNKYSFVDRNESLEKKILVLY